MSLQQHPVFHAQRAPNHPAVINASSGAVLTYAELNQASIAWANRLSAMGLQHGDHVAVMVKNHEGFYPVIWGGLRAGLIVTPISTQLKPSEAVYIARDCGAKAVFLDTAIAAQYPELEAEFAGLGLCLLVDCNTHHQLLAPASPQYAELEGDIMLYSSGSTGFPKGIVGPWQRAQIGEALTAALLLQGIFQADSADRFLLAAPLYHAAPLHWSCAMQRLGGTVVLMERFDAEAALEAIDKHQVTLSQWVPTMLVRMLKLPQAVRARYQGNSHRAAMHLAAPCAVAIKEQMIDWWGPIVHEFYSGSEGNGQTYINATDWLTHKGSVGRAITGALQILDDQGNSLPCGEVGHVFFAGGRPFDYHNDSAKTASSRSADGASTLGDMGYVDAEGFLYLTGRSNTAIISGGVNIYPKEVENTLLQHPAIIDAVVMGLPDSEYGEKVVAAVQLKQSNQIELADEEADIIKFCKSQIASVKCPKAIYVMDSLPRMETGKIYMPALIQQVQNLQHMRATPQHEAALAQTEV